METEDENQATAGSTSLKSEEGELKEDENENKDGAVEEIENSDSAKPEPLDKIETTNEKDTSNEEIEDKTVASAPAPEPLLALEPAPTPEPEPEPAPAPAPEPEPALTIEPELAPAPGESEEIEDNTEDNEDDVNTPLIPKEEKDGAPQEGRDEIEDDNGSGFVILSYKDLDEAKDNLLMQGKDPEDCIGKLKMHKLKRARQLKKEAPPTMAVSIFRWIYELCACCNPLLPPLKRRCSSSDSSPCPPEIMSDLKEPDEPLLAAFANVELTVKSHYVRAEGGGNVDDLKLTVLSYKVVFCGGFNYFVKVRVNDGPECVHAKIFKAGHGNAILIGDLHTKKTEADEISEF